MKTAAAFSVVLICLAASLFTPPSHAQTVPTNCRPGGGYNYECAMSVPMPYTYVVPTCGNLPLFTNEADAFAAYRAPFATAECPLTFITEGWINPGPKYRDQDFITPCPGEGALAP